MMKNTQNGSSRKKVQDYSYCLSSNIGKGYSSQVYRGRNDTTDQVVAIKVIDMRMLKGEVHKSLLSSEIEVLKSFKNARNIIQVFDILTTKNNTYIVTQLCDGGDLSKLISNKRGLPQREAVEYLKQIVDGYSQISSNRIIHRDLKPANILLKNGKVKIADFGFAMRSCDSQKYSSYNVGSPIYMPPQALNQNKYSFKSDIWAIGVIFYELLTGRTPWKAKTEKQLGRQLMSVPITKLLPDGLTTISAQFLERTLTVNYDKRMSPSQLQNFMHKFDISNIPSSKCTKTTYSFLTGSVNTQHSIQTDDNDHNKRHETSLNKNTINPPKNMRSTFLNKPRGNLTTFGTMEDIKSGSATKTSFNTKTQTNLDLDCNRKQISKQLLSQIHFCRFAYKLLGRIQNKMNGEVSQGLKQSMAGLIFQKLHDVIELNCLSLGSSGYRKSNDHKKICQIAQQYQQKYQKQLMQIQCNWKGFDVFETQIITQIKTIFQDIKSSDLQGSTQKVIVLDYLVTLRQLSNLLSRNDLEMFHMKSKIQTIVEGTPAKVITQQHMRAITSKLKSIKLI